MTGSGTFHQADEEQSDSSMMALHVHQFRRRTARAIGGGIINNRTLFDERSASLSVGSHSAAARMLRVGHEASDPSVMKLSR
jgi:hypothetical protein